MSDIYDVKLSRKALRDLKKVPRHIAMKLQGWVDAVAHEGLREVSKVPGYHDEPLKGDRLGQRSICLNKAYRAIYVVKEGVVSFVEVEEVNKHDY